MTDQDPTSPADNEAKDKLTITIQLGEEENNIIRVLTDPTAGRVVSAFLAALTASNDPRYVSAFVCSGHLKATPKKRGDYYHLTIVLLLIDGPTEYHMRVGYLGNHWLTRLGRGDFIGIVGRGRRVDSAQGVYIFQFPAETDDGKPTMAYAEFIGGLAIWRRLSTETGGQVDTAND